MLKHVLLESLEEAIHIETDLEGVISTDGELVFPIGDEVGEAGDPSRYFVLHVDDDTQVGDEWDGNYHLDLMDDSSDTATASRNSSTLRWRTAISRSHALTRSVRRRASMLGNKVPSIRPRH